MSAIAIFGATSTIAQAIAEQYVRLGSPLILVARSGEKLSAVKDHLICIRTGASVQTIQMDFEDLQGLANVVDEIFAKSPLPSVTIVAHGVLLSNSECLADKDAFTKNISVNFTSAAYLANLIGMQFAKLNTGVIVLIGSVAGDRGRQSNFCYGAAKAALSTFADGLRASLAPRGVHVVEIKPGIVATAMTAHLPRSPLMANPETVARDTLKAISARKRRIYTPGFWKWIMRILRSVPDFIFERLKF